MEKLNLKTVDITESNINKIADLFPNVVTEGEKGKVIDFDLLKQELSDQIVEGNKERYQLTWPGKKEAILMANTPINKTLRPLEEKSVDFANTENIYIEGDNLEVLKILQESYLNKIKMIYIDPPYNTGKDFIYKDKFSKSIEEELLNSGQVDDYGNRLVVNADSSGKYHSDWLSMMYPRLKLARNLLTDDGVIFISIDDNEVDNLKKITDEIFGENNFVCSLVWRKKTGSADAKYFSVITENVLIYTKNQNVSHPVFTKDKNSHDVSRYRLSDEFETTRGKHYIDNLDRGGISYSDSLNYPITCPDGSVTYPNGRTEFINDGWTWTWGKDKLHWGVENGFIEFRKSNTKDSGWSVCYKNYLNVNNKGELFERTTPHKNIILDIINTSATKEINTIFGRKVFQYTKPTELVRRLLSFVYFDKNSIVLDFFSGSATTAHAVMKLNAEDGGYRKFIMVQVPEPIDLNSNKEAYNFCIENNLETNICSIGQERIRRSAKQIKEETNAGIDYGFRVYKVDSSNMKNINFKPHEIVQDRLFELESNIKDDRTPMDLLTSVILDLGLTLDLPIERKKVLNNEVFYVAENTLVACFDTDINIKLINELCTLYPLKLVFRESCFENDNDKINVSERVKRLSPNTEIHVL